MFNDRQGGWMGGVGMMRPHAMQTGGYDSSGINPGGQHAPQAPQGLSQFFQLGPLSQGYPQMPAPYGQSQGGYDSSGINPHGMYTGGQMPQQSTFPQNPGGFQPASGLTGMFNRFRGN